MLRAGSHAPDFALSDLRGEAAPIATHLAAGPVLLAFFKVSCPTCQLTFPFLERMAAGGRLTVLGISQDNPERTAEFCRIYGITFPVLVDPEEGNYAVSNAFRITHVPTMFLLEGERKIEWALNGFDRKALDQLGTRFRTDLFRPGERIPDFKPG
ncbi:MAG: peroxiredoxin family protein [Bryobacteraceae bacterium]